MTIEFEILKDLSLGDLKRLLAYKEHEEEINSLLESRAEHLERAQELQAQIDKLITEGTGIVQKKRHGPTVKAMCIEVLNKKKAGLTAAEIKRKVVELYPYKNSRTLYNQIFIALTRNREFNRVDGKKFTLNK